MFANYNAARQRDAEGYDYKGYTVKDVTTCFDSEPCWNVMKDGVLSGQYSSREWAHRMIDELTA